MSADVIYLDNAATSWPKPACVAEAMTEFLARSAGNPGRGGHRLARMAAQPPENVRKLFASAFGASSVERVVLTHGCTDAVNIAIHGVLSGSARSGLSATRPHVLASSVEHNAVLRTLQCYAERDAIALQFVPCDGRGWTDPDVVRRMLRAETELVCVSHASNACGTIQPVREIGTLVREQTERGLLLVDAAQTAGHVGIRMDDDHVDLLTVAGHKGLLGPTGTGALLVGERAWPEDARERRLVCERRGGTGAAGRGMSMPDTLPDALEAGTVNAVGFAGLLAGMCHEIPGRHDHEQAAVVRLLDGLGTIRGITTQGLPTSTGRTAVVLFTIDGWHPREAAAALDDDHGVCVRGGTHCAPLLHEALGNGDLGALRISPGWATTPNEIDRVLEIIDRMAKDARQRSFGARCSESSAR
ncbi:MAG: aminotransferase class V-fold PLP-dependent enzyme [Planctomycetota bacterium]